MVLSIIWDGFPLNDFPLVPLTYSRKRSALRFSFGSITIRSFALELYRTLFLNYQSYFLVESNILKVLKFTELKRTWLWIWSSWCVDYVLKFILKIFPYSSLAISWACSGVTIVINTKWLNNHSSFNIYISSSFLNYINQ